MADLRSKLFTALTGRAADVSGAAQGDVRGMLMAIGGPSSKTQSGIDLTKAASALGVSRRTAERWLSTGQRPRPRNATALARKARQAATTKAGRRAALAGSPVQRAAARGARISITALQGPHTRDYMRKRTTQILLDPADAQAMFDAWEQGGDKGFMTWATTHWGGDPNTGRLGEYVDGWQFGDVDDVTIETPYGGGWR